MQQPHHPPGSAHDAAASEGAWPGGAPPLSSSERRAVDLAEEASRYLAAVDLFRREGYLISWASERPE
jgi:hypothetical protein